MRDYRAYILGINGHRFIKVAEFLSDHPDDATASKAAEQLVNGHDVEVWDRGRLVARFSPNGEVISPDLAPSPVIHAVLSDSSKNSPSPVPPISLGRASEEILTGSRAL
jgi:hypothetical protein